VGVAVGVALLPVLPAGVLVVEDVPVVGDCADEVVPVVLLGALVDGDGVGVPVELEELLGVGVGLAVSASHCQIVGLEFAFPVTTPDPPPKDAARVCGAMAAVTNNPAAVVSKTPPALRPIDAGRTRAKHM
jgi:hypothetical protein